MNNEDKINIIPIPCPQKWDDMGKDEKMKEGHTARMCDACQHHIHDISEMSARQIITLRDKLSDKGQKFCGMVRQPASSNVSRLQHFSLACTMAMAPIALVACGGNTTNHNGDSITPPNKTSGSQNQNLLDHHGPAVGMVARPQVDNEARPKLRMVTGMIALPPEKR